MGFFDRNKIEKSENQDDSSTEDRQNNILERPRICCIDLDEEITKNLEKLNYNIYKGTLGQKIKIPTRDRDTNYPILLNYDLPDNLHEYDIIIVDLDNSKTIEYIAEDHKRKNVSGKSYISLVSIFPENIFDPRPFSGIILGEKINEPSNKSFLIIVFTTSNYEIEYQSVEVFQDYNKKHEPETINIYSFLKNVFISKIKIGKEAYIQDIQDDFRNLLIKYKDDLIYNQTFHQPTIWKDGSYVNDPKCIPLLKNNNNEVISFYHHLINKGTLILPQINNKKDFLGEFLQKIAPELFPELFPFSTQFKWKEQVEYWLPNHSNLLKDKENLEIGYKKKIESKEKDISSNYEKYSFLHDLITRTGDELVIAAQKYFKWLGFQNVKIMDEIQKDPKSNLKEEDLQIDLDNGLLIIEVKGIGSTSTDPDCSQISKIKYRRCEERKKFDVFALYLVNHQRHLPPLKRVNPPFTSNQIRDARNDKRGLLTTWQLFNLYFEIQNKVFSKEEARNNLTQFGLVNFRPHNLRFIDEPKEFFHNNYVCIVNIENIEIKIGDILYIEKNDRFYLAEIKSLMINDNSVQKVNKGEVGIKLDIKLKKHSKLWIKNN